MTTTATRCFLCREAIAPDDLENAWERVLTDSVPVQPDFAHWECAHEAGYFDQPEPEEDAPEETD